MGIVDDIEAAARKADDLAERKRGAGLSVAKHRAAGRAEGLMEAARMLRGQPKTEAPIADGETLRRQCLPGAAERWEALPWENRMALLGGLAEEAAEHQRNASDHHEGAHPSVVPLMRERFAALAVTYETAHAALMRADTVSSKDKSQEEVAAERAKYAAPVDDKAAIVAFLRAEETKYRMALHETTRRDVAERHTARASILATMAAYIERGDYLTGDVK
jgi:hypothetical protein